MAGSSDTAALAVIGAGPGGYAAAFLAADAGMDVALIDPEADPGGVCLYRGCIPSKALLHAARVLAEAREAQEWGVRFGEPKIDLKKLRSWKDGVVQGLTGGLGQLSRRRKIRRIRGRAVFSGEGTLEIGTDGGGKKTLRFEQAIVAAGSRPALPGMFPEGSSRIWDSTKALDLPEVPHRLLVVGGGYIGLELGTVYAALGSRVTVVEMMPGLLPGADKDLVRPLARRLEDRFEAILLETKVTEVKERGKRLRVTLEGKDAEGGREFDRVLVAVGRKPDSAALKPERAGIGLTPEGFIQVDRARRTSNPKIFAIGDLAGEPMLAHKATHEARVAVDAVAGKPSAFDPAAIPAVVFTDPEIAWCGLTETQARKEGRKVKVLRFPWSASGRAATTGRPDGLTKLIAHPGTGRILGAGITGAGAGELISECVLAMEMAATAEDLGLTIHPHPTLSETLMEAGDLFAGSSVHLHRG